MRKWKVFRYWNTYLLIELLTQEFWTEHDYIKIRKEDHTIRYLHENKHREHVAQLKRLDRDHENAVVLTKYSV